MTDLEPVDLDDYERGHDLRIKYRSQRTGNVITRKGTVSGTFDVEGAKCVDVHVEAINPLRHVYIALSPGETTGGDECTAAISITASADGFEDDPPKIGKRISTALSVERSSILGPVENVTRTDGTVFGVT